MDKEMESFFPLRTLSHTHTLLMKYYSVVRNQGSLSFTATSMNPEDILPKEARQRKKKSSHDFTYTWNLKILKL